MYKKENEEADKKAKTKTKDEETENAGIVKEEMRKTPKAKPTKERIDNQCYDLYSSHKPILYSKKCWPTV